MVLGSVSGLSYFEISISSIYLALWGCSKRADRTYKQSRDARLYLCGLGQTSPYCPGCQDQDHILQKRHELGANYNWRKHGKEVTWVRPRRRISQRVSLMPRLPKPFRVLGSRFFLLYRWEFCSHNCSSSILCKRVNAKIYNTGGEQGQKSNQVTREL